MKWRRLAPLALLVLVVPPVGDLSSTAASASAACRAPNTYVLHHAPVVHRLANDARVRVWDTGRRRNHMTEMRLSEVFVPKESRAHLALLTSGALTRSRLPAQVMSAHPHAVAVSNADVFDPARGSLPVGDQVLDGTVVKARHMLQNVVAISHDGQVAPAHMRLVGSVTAGDTVFPVTGLNWQGLTGTGINVYAQPWGYQRRPHGEVDVVVSGGYVRDIRRRPAARGRPPAGSQKILTAAPGPAAAFLKHLHRGQRVDVQYGFEAPDAPFEVQQAVNHGAPFLRAGERWPVLCSHRNEQLRPRTAVGWDAEGNLMLVTVSGRAMKYGMLYGGSTLRNMEYYMQQLGAVNAYAMDGGGSTALVVRRHGHHRPERIDRPGTRQRPVPTFLAVVSR